MYISPHKTCNVGLKLRFSRYLYKTTKIQWHSISSFSLRLAWISRFNLFGLPLQREKITFDFPEIYVIPDLDVYGIFAARIAQRDREILLQ